MKPEQLTFGARVAAGAEGEVFRGSLLGVGEVAIKVANQLGIDQGHRRAVWEEREVAYAGGAW